MSSPETLVQAALQRLAARLGSSAMDAAAQLSLLAQDAPQRLQQELELFWEEVQQEAQRMDQQQQNGTAAAAAPAPVDLQQQLDDLRAQVASFSRRLEERG
ncbi:MAG: hypothetical protein VKJ87_05900 [Synechococcus sp.]|nr:hypothetical protein [Synechococcus sp.]